MEYNIIFLDFPVKIKGICVVNSDDFYTIYINSRLSTIEQQKAIKHELQHYQLNHFYSFEELGVCELEANLIK